MQNNVLLLVVVILESSFKANVRDTFKLMAIVLPKKQTLKFYKGGSQESFINLSFIELKKQYFANILRCAVSQVQCPTGRHWFSL